MDIGTLRSVRDGLYLWTDLWLDVIAPEPPTNYRVLDADEFGYALRKGLISTDLAARAMERLHSLVNLLHDGGFPPQEVRQAEAFAANKRSSDH